MKRSVSGLAICLVCGLLSGLNGIALAEDLPVIRFEPSAADQVAHTTKTKKIKVKKPKARKLGRFLRGAAYVAARGAQGYAQGSNQYNGTAPQFINTLGPNGAHSYTYFSRGNTTFLNQTY